MRKTIKIAQDTEGFIVSVMDHRGRTFDSIKVPTAEVALREAEINQDCFPEAGMIFMSLDFDVENVTLQELENKIVKNIETELDVVEISTTSKDMSNDAQTKIEIGDTKMTKTEIATQIVNLKASTLTVNTLVKKHRLEDLKDLLKNAQVAEKIQKPAKKVAVKKVAKKPAVKKVAKKVVKKETPKTTTVKKVITKVVKKATAAAKKRDAKIVKKAEKKPAFIDLSQEVSDRLAAIVANIGLKAIADELEMSSASVSRWAYRRRGKKVVQPSARIEAYDNLLNFMTKAEK